ncbi:MAG: tRNA (adenosine(37)-N6)-threonylcarbamoyltransferase complex dimerization subunit type 1 TsaB [Epulopiscium sp. Nuni2H_MBin001]|nr:MAG: tRNA (adenosine(37)-N6)-threonylcarbamoyltransferase complex dimerization subunit type 1 TsaB [Epulopiscium sp. Nuni2H_MBin001]
MSNRILAIDTSAMAASVALVEDGKLVADYYICNELTHAETIMPMVENIKLMTKLDVETIDAIAVTSGPGSFTGLRIGVSAAKALALALNIKLIGISTLDVLAYSVYNTNKIICPIMDARRNQVYTALYTFEDSNLTMLQPHMAVDIHEILELALTYKKDVVFVGDGIDAFKTVILDTLGQYAHFAPSFLSMQRACVLAHMAQYAKPQNPDELVPIYLRKSQAERELEQCKPA